MTTDKLKGKAKDIAGTAKEKTGRATGNDDLEAKGSAEKLEGKGQGLVGKVKGTAKDLKDKVT